MLLTYEEREQRITELQKIHIPLDIDPVANGLAGINDKIAKLQAFKDRVNSLLLEAIKNKHEADILFNDKNFEYEQRLATLLATDAEVQNQKSEKLRVAVANTRMSELVLFVHHAERDLADADSYYKQVSHAYDHLEGVNSSLSRQISVIQMGLQIGEITREDLGTLFGKKMTVTK